MSTDISASTRLNDFVKKMVIRTQGARLLDGVFKAGNALVDVISNHTSSAKQSDVLYSLKKQIDQDTALLNDNMKEVAKGRHILSPEDQQQADALLMEAKRELDDAREQWNAKLQELRDIEDSNHRSICNALSDYHTARVSLRDVVTGCFDGMDADKVLSIREFDRLFDMHSVINPKVALIHLCQEVEKDRGCFDRFVDREKYYRLKIWIGRFRMLQDVILRKGLNQDGDLTDYMTKTFLSLKDISRIYEPGYIEAFRQDTNEVWASYVNDAWKEYQRFKKES